MSTPVRGDAAFRYTEDGQSAIHHLGHPLDRPVTNTVQTVSSFQPWDMTTAPRRIAIGDPAYDLDALIRRDGNPQSLADFLAAAKRGATLDYFPSLSEPSLSFPCHLVDAPEIGLDEQFWHARRYGVPVRLRRTDGGTWMALIEEPLLYWKAGNVLPGWTFTRASSAWQLSEWGVIEEVSTNIWRTDWWDSDADGRVDTPSLPIESAATNDILDSADVDVAGSANWTLAGGAWTQASATSVIAGETAHRYTNDGATGSHGMYQATPNLVGTSVVGSAIVENVSALVTSVGIFDVTAAGFVVLGTYTWATDSIVETSSPEGSSTGVRRTVLAEYGPNGGRVVRLEVYGIAATATNAGRLYIYPSGTSVNSLVAILHHAQHEDGVKATTPIVNTGSAGTRAAETGYGSYVHGQQTKTVYLKFKEWGTAFGGNLGVYLNGAAAGSGARFQVYSQSSSDGRYSVLYNNGTASAIAQITAPNAVSYDDDVELLCVLDYNADGDGDVSISQSVDGGATTTPATASGPSGGLVTGAVWGASRAYLGSLGSSAQGVNPLLEAKELPGVQSWATMRAL